MLLAGDIMTRDVQTVAPDAQIDTAIDIMIKRRASGVPVVTDSGQIVGIVTEGDLLRRVETTTDLSHGRKPMKFLEFLLGSGKEITNYVRSHSRRVSDLMTENVVTVTEETPLAEVVRLMEKHRVRRLPVEHGGRLVGIIARSDLVAALGRRLAEVTPGLKASDPELEARICAALDSAGWFASAAKSSVDVRVADGIATMEGVIHDERLRTAIRVAVENVPGIARVKDHIVFVEPMTGSIYPA
jgi:CBS domain-containing protein